MSSDALTVPNVSMRLKSVIIGTIAVKETIRTNRIAISRPVMRASSGAPMPFVFPPDGGVMDTPIVPTAQMKPIAVCVALSPNTGFVS